MGGRLVSPTFVGRGEALAAAQTMLARIEAARASHLLVAGEAGIGKTRFSEAVGDQARAEGFLVLHGGCVQLGSSELPYAPIAEALRELARRLDPQALASVVGKDGAALSRIVPALDPGKVPAIEARASAPARWQLMGALIGLLGRLAAAAPVLLIVEDLHWADSASLETLAFLLRSLRGERVGLLLTFRSDELHRRHPLRPWLGEIERLGSVERVDLEALSTAETGSLIAAIRGAEPPSDLAERIRARSDGNPFFIEELLAGEERATASIALRPSLRDILLARIESVPDEARTILSVAAVVSRSVDPALLGEVTGLTPRELDAGLDACIERRVLLLDRAEGRDRIAFRHALIAEVVYDSLLPDERIHLHRAIAEVLAARIGAPGAQQPGRWAELAGHWDAARDEPRAFAGALHAAEEAEHAFAWAAAVAQYKRALAGWALVPEPEAIAGFDRLELLTRAAIAAHPGHADVSIPLLREAIAEADRRGEAARGSLLRGWLGFDLWTNGQPAEAQAVYREALALVPPEPPSAERAWILARLAQVLMLEGSDHESQAVTEEAIAMARIVGDRRVEGHAMVTLAGDLASLGRCALAVETMERALAIAIEVGDPRDVGRAYINGTEVLGICGRDEDAVELAREGMERTAAMGTGEVAGVLIGFLAAEVLYGCGHWPEAASLLATGRLDVPGTDADPLPLASRVEALSKTVDLHVATGDRDAATRQLAWVGEQLRDGFEAEYQLTGPYTCARAELALWQDRPRDALLAVEEGLPRLEHTDDSRYRMRLLRLGLRAAADLAEIARDRRDPAGSAEAVETAAALRARSAPALETISGMDGGLALELAAEAATVDAEETRLRGSSDPVAWHEAAARWLARGRPYHRAYARFREAEASLGAGDRSNAAEALQEAGEIAGHLGARPLLSSIEALGRRARIPLGPQSTERPHPTEPGPRERTVAVATELGLTSREREVLELIAQGMTNRQIADALFISVHTAGIHVSHILGKLDVASRTEAAGKAYRLGLVDR